MKISHRIIAISLTILFLASCQQTTCHKYEPINNSSERTLYALESLQSMYFDNTELFRNVANIIYNNDELKRVIINHNEEDWEIYTTYDCRFFEDSEWKEVQELFDKTGVYQIIRSLKYGNDIVYFIFYDNDSSTTLDLYYNITNDEQVIMSYKGRSDEVTRVDDYWWIIVNKHGDMRDVSRVCQD